MQMFHAVVLGPLLHLLISLLCETSDISGFTLLTRKKTPDVWFSAHWGTRQQADYWENKAIKKKISHLNTCSLKNNSKKLCLHNAYVFVKTHKYAKCTLED